MSIQTIGLEGSGRTTLIKALALNDPKAPDRESYHLSIESARFEIGDNVPRADLVLFCLDGNNLEQLPACKALIGTIAHKMVIVQTKSDLQTIDDVELREFLEVDASVPVLSTSALQGDGLTELKALLGELLKYSFEAEPRVVPTRGKYQTNTQPSKPQLTFINLMQDKRIKLLDPMQQELEYIRLEKERIKMENMHSQLNNFKKKLKKDDAYDIKATANPRISVNLEFFLTDTASTIQNPVSTLSTQTDAFRKKPDSPKFVPKKTGIDAATQVEDYELFNFDREVTPILDVICTKTLEQACLEIEQEEEVKAMNRFKEAFDKRRAQEKFQQQNTVNQEKEQIKIKNSILKQYREKYERIQRVVHKAQAMKIAQQYLHPLQDKVIQGVYESGYYPNQLENQLKTQFLDWLVDRTATEVDKIVTVKEQMKVAFNNQFDGLTTARKQNDQAVEKRRKRQQKRMINYSDLRAIRVVYLDESPVITVLAHALSKQLDGSYEEWRKTYESRVAELETKLDANEMPEEEYLNTKRQEYPDVVEGYYGMCVNDFKRLAFSFAHDQYYKTKDWKLKPMALFIKSDGSFTVIDETTPRDGKVSKLKNFRQNLKQSDDQAIVIRLQDINSDVVSIVFGVMLPDVANNTKQIEWANNARFGLYDAEYCVPFAQTQFMKSFKLEDIVKVPDEPELADAPQSAFFHCFTMQKRFKQFGGWYIERTIGQTKGMLDNEVTLFLDKLSTFVVEHYEYNLERDKEIVSGYLEKERDQMPTVPEKNAIITKAKLFPVKRVITQQDDSMPAESNRDTNRDEPTETPKTLQYNIALPSLVVPMVDFEKTEFGLIQHLQLSSKDLINSCQDGFELHALNQPFLRVKQLHNVRSVGDIVLLRKAPPPPLKEEEPIVQDNDDGNQQNDNDDD